MLLGFQRQFAPYVEEASKTHTVRGVRKIHPRAGETCHCYVDPRQKTMRLLGRFPCVRVQDITLWPRVSVGPPDFSELTGVLLRVAIDGVELSEPEVEAFFFRDGFRGPFEDPPRRHDYPIIKDRRQALSVLYPATAAAMRFWKARAFPFAGHLIHWEYR